MTLGDCLTSFFAASGRYITTAATTAFLRARFAAIKSHVTYEMFYHVEHHLFPVPTRRLPILAQRLDDAAPELTSKHVF
jgi:fatty acid desaturase